MQHMHNTEQICNFLSGEEMAALLSRVVEGRQHGKATRVPRSFALLSFLESAKLALPAQRAVIAARFRERAIRPTMAIILTPQSGVLGVRQTTFAVRRWLIGTIPRMGLGGNSRAQRCRHARLADARLARDQYDLTFALPGQLLAIRAAGRSPARGQRNWPGRMGRYERIVLPLSKWWSRQDATPAVRIRTRCRASAPPRFAEWRFHGKI